MSSRDFPNGFAAIPTRLFSRDKALGYPLLYLSVGNGANRQWLLAPVFLWPISVELDVRRQGHIVVGRDLAAGPPQFNGVMASWVSRRFSLALSVPSEDDLNELDWDKIKRHLSRISKQFNLWPEIDCSGRLEAVPSAISLKDHLGHRFYHAAVLGSFQSKDGAILGDLDALATLDLVEGVAAAFAEGTHLPTPTEERAASRE